MVNIEEKYFLVNFVLRDRSQLKIITVVRKPIVIGNVLPITLKPVVVLENIVCQHFVKRDIKADALFFNTAFGSVKAKLREKSHCFGHGSVKIVQSAPM